MEHLREITLYGRYTLDPEGTLWLASSASGAGFTVRNARYLRFRLRGDDTCGDPARAGIRPRYAVYVNGRKAVDALMERTEPGAPAEETVTIFEGTEPWSVEIRFSKLSECTQSLMGIREIETDGDVAPVPARKRRIEFIGDSITCGYGVEGAPGQVFTTATENAEKAYGWLTARALDAECMLTCFSGHGLISGYTEGEINDRELVQPYYEHVGGNSFVLPGGKRLQEIPWDFTRFRPDAVVIHLGTNDASWCRGIPERRALYRDRYTAFLPVVRRNNPGARILCVLGTMTEDLNADMREAAERYIRESGDGLARILTVPLQDKERDGTGTDEHPSAATQRLLAERVAAELKAWLQEV